MSKKSKALEKICSQPTPANIKWKELVSVLVALGYEEHSGTGSRKKFFHPVKNALISCHKPHPNPEVDKGCLADIVSHLKDHGFITDHE